MRRLAALTCALVLTCAVASARADTVVPVEGPWHATTSAGLPVSFEVIGGQVVNPVWRFRWGFCGSFTNDVPATVPVDAAGHWKFTDLRGPWIEGTFVAPDRVEGSLTAPDRQTPGCPETHATFLAEPGAAPPEPPPVFVIASVLTRRFNVEPPWMQLTRSGSLQLYDLEWRNFGEPVARAEGRAFLRHGCSGCRDREVTRPRVSVKLNQLSPNGSALTYHHISYTFHGPRPRGFPRHGSRILE
jgi:hypothetical protein